MFRWRFLRQFPKFVLIFCVLVGSTGLFGAWWFFRRSPAHKEAEAISDAQKKKIQEKIEKVVAAIPSMEGNLLVADGDLYQLDSGRLLLKGWFKGGMPTKLFLDAEAGKLIGVYEKGLVRFGLDGKEEAAIGNVAVNQAMDLALFVKEKDIWKAQIDFNQFKLVDEERVTSTAAFMDKFFVENILLRTDKMIIQRNLNQLLRINLETGDVTSIKTALSGMRATRSPNERLMIGAASGRGSRMLLVYNVEVGEAKQFELEGKMGATEFGWLSNDRCAFLQGTTELGVFEGAKQTVRHVASLPFPCQEISKPSPSGRQVFCSSFRGVALVDVDSGKVEALPDPAQAYEWIDDTTLMCARDVPDTNKRGTWLKQIGQEEVKLSTEPYIFARRGGASVRAIKEAGIVFFATRGGMFKMKQGETQAQMFAPLSRPLTRFVYIEKWRR